MLALLTEYEREMVREYLMAADDEVKWLRGGNT